MAPSALTDLDLAVDFFERGAQLSPRARQALPILKNLKERALSAFNEYRNRHLTPSLDIQLRIGPEDQFQDELAIFGGQTRVVTNKFLSRRKNRFPSRPRAERERCERCESDTPVSPSQATSPGQTSGPGASPQSASTPSDDGGLPPQVEDQMEDVHPSLMEYLSLFPSAASISVVNDHQQAGPSHHPHSNLMDTSVAPSATGSTSASVFSSSAGAGPSAFSPMPVQSPTIAAATTTSPTPMTGIHTQPQQGVPSPADPLSFLSVLPEASGLGGSVADPSLFFAGLAHDPASLDTNIFNSAFGGGDFGDQWNSLMRETGLFDAHGNFKQDSNMMSPATTVTGEQGGSRDMYPTF